MKTEFLPLAPAMHRQLVSIEQRAHSHPWSESLLAKLDGKFACNVGIFVDGKLTGYFYAQCVSGEATLLNIVVDPNFQGQGLGKQLLSHFIHQMTAMKAEEAWLEVRESNTAAIALYESSGFNEIDRRVGYYPKDKGKEDALVMCYWFG
ncbi:ribosomal-protein-alanine N-acetyltransferase [Veronia nyctiphanis]|uniref:[Ribosomal protein bS18]-alanine N-acetyltransferase n=1 Tax=Veronia nyctiphanis TaxID=1278244 RepID=A0A4Q0YXA2_9GAMM|nr:ribosomal protein S18-alanine N-acetyltransferase [Veronia nyctiphanis]RXJ73819.1 ribosomal-protein-alanine N-acetyltransferase [Veronia nyctiphanis]